MKTLRTPQSTSRSLPALCLLASALWLSPLFTGLAVAQTRTLNELPPLPSIAATYYYEGFDEANNRHVYLASTGVRYYVDATTFYTTVGAATTDPSASAYRAVVAATGVNFQFYNNNPLNYTVTTGTRDDGVTLFTATDFSVRSGNWYANDVTFSITTAAESAIWLEGVSASMSAAIVDNIVGGEIVKYTDNTARVIYNQPVAFIGTNVNAIVEITTAGSRQAISLRNGATAYISGGTLSKTVLGVVVTDTDGVITGTTFDAGASEAIYLVGNQESMGTSSHFYGENLTIVADGPNIGAITMADGNNSMTLKNSTITSITTRNNASQAISLNDPSPGGAGNHFYGENLLITNNSGCIVGLGVSGGNSFTLVSSTMINNGVGAAIRMLATAASTGDRLATDILLVDTTILTTANYAPIFQQIGNRATLTITDCTLTTNGVGSTGIRLVAQNDNYDSTRNVVRITDSILEARNASAIDINIEAGNNSTTAGYGQAGGGGKNIGTKVEDAYDIIIHSSTITGGVAAMRLATAGSGTSPYANFTNVFVYDSTFSGGIEMVAGALAAYACGASLVFTASNAVLDGGISITGSTIFRRSNQAMFHVYDSTWDGNITLTNRGNLTLHFTNTPIEGNLSMSGSTQVQLRLADSTITGAISVADTAVLTGEILGAGQIASFTASGGFTDLTLDHVPATSISANGTADARLRIGGEVAVATGIHLSGTAMLGITLRDTASFTGDVTIVDRATFALDSAKPGAVSLNGDIANGGIWHIPSKTILNGNFALTNYLGTISIINASADNLVLTKGLTGNGRLDVISIDGSITSNAEFRVIHDPTGTFISATSAPLILSHPVDYGLASYHLDNRTDGAYLVGGLDSGSFGAGGAAVFNSRALIAEDWFAAIVPLNQRLGLIRQINAGILSGDMGSARAQGDAGSFWLQARTEDTRVDRGGRSLNFTSRTLGFTAGVDTRWDSDTANFTIGLFADSARIDNKFTGAARGRATGAGGGIYATYQHRAGGYVSVIGRFDAQENSLDTHNPNNAFTASYHTQSGGAVLELGWRFAFNSGWWLEPAYQFGVASLPGVDYKTESSKAGNNIDISVGDARASQHYVRFAFGKALDTNWHLRGHLAFASVNASGGDFNTSDFNANFNIAGNRAEAAFGVTRLISQSTRLSLDTAYTHASDYKRPFSIILGWSMAW